MWQAFLQYIYFYSYIGLKSPRSSTQEYELVQSYTDSLESDMDTDTSFDDDDGTRWVYSPPDSRTRLRTTTHIQFVVTLGSGGYAL
jgi:hypothetical protein